MQLSNDFHGFNTLRNTIIDCYEKSNRSIKCFLRTEDKEWGWHYEHFLLDRKYVFRYGIGIDRQIMLGSLELAIGPHYFGPSDFWDYANSERFSIEASTEAVENNLVLLDEFLGKSR